MGAALQCLAHFVGDRAHVSAGGYAGAEMGAVGLDGEDFEFFNLDLHRLEDDFFLFAGKFVGRDALNLFCGEKRIANCI